MRDAESSDEPDIPKEEKAEEAPILPTADGEQPAKSTDNKDKPSPSTTRTLEDQQVSKDIPTSAGENCDENETTEEPSPAAEPSLSVEVIAPAPSDNSTSMSLAPPEEQEDTEQKDRVVIQQAASNLLDQDNDDEAEDPVVEEDKNNEISPSDEHRDEESRLLGGAEIMFERSNSDSNNRSSMAFSGWDNLRWLSYAGIRKLQFCKPVSRFEAGRQSLFWSGEQYLDHRLLAVYEEPRLILVLRRPSNLAEVRALLDLPPGTPLDDPENALKAYWVVESAVDPATCKLKVSPLTTVTSVCEGRDDDPRYRSCFQLITPAETIVLSAVPLRSGAERALTSFVDTEAFLTTTSAEQALKKALCDAHMAHDEIGTKADLSWKHQIILGTLHSYVVLGDLSLLNKALTAALKSQEGTLPPGEANNHVDPVIIDALDENQKAPLHYACSTRSSGSVESLVRAGANVSIRINIPDNSTPLHLCARTLDYRSIAAILNTPTGKAGVNDVDGLDRTPMYLAVMRGRNVGGRKDQNALSQCLSLFKEHGGTLILKSADRHPVSQLAADWEGEELEVLLQHTRYRYPLEGVSPKAYGISLSALFQYPLHSALIAIRKEVKRISSKETLTTLDILATGSSERLVGIIDMLLSCGFEPNERIEGLAEPFFGCEELALHIGFAPIQILAAAAIDATTNKEAIGVTSYLQILKVIADSVEVLVKNGARLSLPPPPTSRGDNRPSTSALDSSVGSEGSADEVHPVDRNQVVIHSNKNLEELLGTLRLQEAQSFWTSIKAVSWSKKSAIHDDTKTPIADCDAPGGSDEKTCAICWSVFGKIRNRRHRCRVTRRHVCDECSSKRVIAEGEEHRISDGQFLLAERDSKQKPDSPAKSNQKAAVTQRTSSNAMSARLDRLEAEEKAQRESLFGNVMEKMTKAMLGEKEQPSASDQVNGLASQLGQTRDALNARGEKLNTLAEKSDRLVSASQDFASMAKELNKTQNKGMFW